MKISLLSFVLAVNAGTCSGLLSISMSAESRHTLFDVPVSNNGARCRIILYKKGLPESEVKVVSPADLGGFKSESYLAVNPQGKVYTFAQPPFDFFSDIFFCILTMLFFFLFSFLLELNRIESNQINQSNQGSCHQVP